jgi:hypothetical protein
MNVRSLASAIAFISWLGIIGPAPVVAQTRPVGDETSTLPKTSAPLTPGKPSNGTWTAPLTPYGQPDLEGVWRNNSATPLERPAALEGRPLLTDDEIKELQRRADRIFKNGHSAFAVGDAVFLAALADIDRYENPNATASSVWMVEKEFEHRTSLVSDPPDGRIPPLTSGARERQAADAARQRRLSASEDLSNPLRCITYGVPRFGGRYGDTDFGYIQILQAPGYVVVMMEAIHETRIIPLDGRPRLSERIRQWNGDSRGRWEGATLVVETTNFSRTSNFMGAAENLQLVERFTRVAPDTISYEVTLNDPTTWTRPWTVVIHLRQTVGSMFEFACHEGNHSMLGILAGARADERAAESGSR